MAVSVLAVNLRGGPLDTGVLFKKVDAGGAEKSLFSPHMYTNMSMVRTIVCLVFEMKKKILRKTNHPPWIQRSAPKLAQAIS